MLLTKTKRIMFEQTFPFPSLEMQKKIVSQLDTLSTETKNLENIYQQKLNAIEELKKSILQKAFSGQLSELGFLRLKDDRIIAKSEILKSFHPSNPNSDSILSSSNPINHNSDNK